MSNPFRDAATKDVYYPDEQADVGTVRLVSEEPVPADDVPHEEARYGQYVEVENHEKTVWFSAPQDLLRALGDAEAEPGHVFQVRATERDDEEHAPWQYQVAHDPEQH